MKTTITSLLVQIAIDCVGQFCRANRDQNPVEEARTSITAHLMIAVALEGFVNEVGERILDSWTWKKLERSNTPLKWRILSGFEGRTMFDPGAEPLRTVEALNKIRNGLVHPKLEDHGDEVTIKSKNGSIERNVRDDRLIEDGDYVIFGLNEIMEQFTHRSAQIAVEKGLAAMRSLRDHLGIAGFDWIKPREVKPPCPAQ